ncbi:MAG: hypothetical protein ACRESZ_13825 [Methylococcales bacterium]
MTINMESGRLPWTGASVKMIRHLIDYCRATVLGDDFRYMPQTATLFIDEVIDKQQIEVFIERMAKELKKEFEIRKQRAHTFAELGLFTKSEIESFLTNHTNAQSWVIHYGINGGLGVERSSVRTREVPRGVIPCSSMRNHGVAWAPADDGMEVWLATSRKEGEEWNWDSDIGHESGHAAFAPVPLFVQSANLLKSMLHVDDLTCANDLQPRHIARIVYAFSEIAVVTLRGELRQTDTGTPIGQKEELLALLRFSHEIMPKFEFDRALSVYEQSAGLLDIQNDRAIYEVAAPMMRVIPKFKSIMKSFLAPSVHELREIIA